MHNKNGGADGTRNRNACFPLHAVDRNSLIYQGALTAPNYTKHTIGRKLGADQIPAEIGVWIDVSSRSRPNAAMLVSRYDLELATSRKWTVDNTGYAVAKIEGKKRSLHRIIAGSDSIVDHINRDRLDNRRSNLRPAGRSVNSHNRAKKPGTSSKFVGVSWRRSRQRWEAEIRINGKSTKIGRFESEIDAALAYDTAALEMLGPLANVNLVCLRLSKCA